MTWHILLVECETACEKKVDLHDDTCPEGPGFYLKPEFCDVDVFDCSSHSQPLLVNHLGVCCLPWPNYIAGDVPSVRLKRYVLKQWVK